MWVLALIAPLPMLALFAQTSTSSSPTFVEQLGAGAAVAAPAYLAILILWRAYSTREQVKDATIAEKDRVIADLNEDRVQRERLLNERAIPVLAQSVQTLSRTPGAIRETLQETSKAVPPDRADRVLSELEQLLTQLRDRPGG